RRSPGAQVRGGVTEVALGDHGVRVDLEPWLDEWGPIQLFGGLGPVTRLIGSAFRFLLLLLVASIALVVARGGVEGSAQRVSDNPVKSTLVGLIAWMLFLPTLVLTVFVLAVTIIGIPLLVLVPFAVLALVLMGVVGFSGTAYAVGQGVRRRLGIGVPTPFADVFFGLLVILLPLMTARLLALGGWPFRPIVLVLLAAGLGVEFLAWASGFGAVLTN